MFCDLNFVVFFSIFGYGSRFCPLELNCSIDLFNLRFGVVFLELELLNAVSFFKKNRQNFQPYDVTLTSN